MSPAEARRPAGDEAARTLAAPQWLMWLLVVPVLALLAMLMVAQVRERYAGSVSALERRDDEHARALAAIARPATDYVRDLRVLMSQAWVHPPDHGPGLRAALQPRSVDGAPDGYTLDAVPPADRERFGQVLWFAPDGSTPSDTLLQRAQTFIEHARPAHQRAAGFAASWLLPSGAAMSVGYPWFTSAVPLRSMGETRLTALAKYRAGGDEQRRDWQRSHPERLAYWSPPYLDDASDRLTVSHGGLIVVDGVFEGEVMLDFRLDDLQTLLGQWREEPGRFWIIDERGDVLADSAQPLIAKTREPGKRTLRLPVVERLPSGMTAADLEAARAMPGHIVPVGDGGLVMASAADSPWTLVHAFPAGALTAPVRSALLPYALIALALLAMFVAGQWLLSTRFVRPARAVLAYLRGLSRDATTPAPRLDRRWQLWVDAVTETYRMQRDLQRRERQSEVFKSAIVDNAQAGIVATDAAGLIVEFNPAAERMFGHPRAQALGRSVTELIVPPRHRAAHSAGMERLRHGGAPRMMGKRVEMEAQRADGSEFPVEMVLWRTEMDGEQHFIASLSDISARRESAREIERQRDALRQSEKLTAMGSLLAGVAHELNNPLAIVMGRASLLEAKTADGALRGDAQRIREAAERCGRIVRTFLAMARQKPTQREPVQINDLVRGAVDLLQYSLRSSGLDVELRLAADLPAVTADADQLGQVLLNLIVNAQQSLVGRPPPLRLRIETGIEAQRPTRPQRVWLRIADSGAGVPEALRERVFDPFFTTKPEGAGTGLGLAVSRSVAREHGGELLLERDGPLGGASFRLSVPVAAAAPVPAASPPPALDAPAAAVARVLVVDDEPQLADVIQDMLESAQLEVAIAESGEVALELLAEARFDAIVSDLRMPGMDGVALWRQVRSRHPRLVRRMVFVTGDTLSAGAREFLAETGCACVEKPFTPAELIERVQACLEPVAG